MKPSSAILFFKTGFYSYHLPCLSWTKVTSNYEYM